MNWLAILQEPGIDWKGYQDIVIMRKEKFKETLMVQQSGTLVKC